MSFHSLANLNLSLDQLHYARYHLSNVHLTGNLKGALATAQLTSDNELLKMTADAEYNLAHSYPDGKVTVDVTQLGFVRTGTYAQTSETSVGIQFKLPREARQNRFHSFHRRWYETESECPCRCISSDSSVYPFCRCVDEAGGWKTLGSCCFCVKHYRRLFSFFQERRIRWHTIWQMKNISFHDASMKFGTAPDWGINGKAAIHALKVDTLQLDTVFSPSNRILPVWISVPE